MMYKPIDMFLICFFCLALGVVLLSGCATPKRTLTKEYIAQLCPEHFPEGECKPCMESISHQEVQKAEELYQECKLERDKCNALLEYARKKHQDCVEGYLQSSGALQISEMNTEYLPGDIHVEERGKDLLLHLPASGWTLSRYRDMLKSLEHIKCKYRSRMITILTPSPIPSSIQRLLHKEQAIYVGNTESNVDEDIVLSIWIKRL